jgi:ketosteroid isomerase-like protein
MQTTLDPIINSWITAFNTHDVAAIVALYTSDAELFDSGMPRPRHGQAEIERWFRWRFSSTPITYTPVDQVTGEGDQVVVSWIARGRGPGALLARSFQMNGESYFTLRDGLIQRQHGVYDHLAVLRQVLPPLRWLPAAVARFVYALYLRWSGL